MYLCQITCAKLGIDEENAGVDGGAIFLNGSVGGGDGTGTEGWKHLGESMSKYWGVWGCILDTESLSDGTVPHGGIGLGVVIGTCWRSGRCDGDVKVGEVGTVGL